MTAFHSLKAYYLGVGEEATNPMVKLYQVQTALKRVGMYNRFWGKAEMRELSQILMPDEEIIGAVNGRYENGFAMLVATDRRLLLVDKKMMFLNVEDVRYDMIAQVEYCASLVNSTTVVHTINNIVRFSSIRQNHLRKLTSFVQEKVMELRHMYHQIAEEQTNPAGYEALPYYYNRPQPYVEAATRPAPAGHIFAQSAPKPYHTNAPLSVRRRISRFYPMND